MVHSGVLWSAVDRSRAAYVLVKGCDAIIIWLRLTHRVGLSAIGQLLSGSDVRDSAETSRWLSTRIENSHAGLSSLGRIPSIRSATVAVALRCLASSRGSSPRDRLVGSRPPPTFVFSLIQPSLPRTQRRCIRRERLLTCDASSNLDSSIAGLGTCGTPRLDCSRSRGRHDGPDSSGFSSSISSCSDERYAVCNAQVDVLRNPSASTTPPQALSSHQSK